jgi:hypothetical protein
VHVSSSFGYRQVGEQLFEVLPPRPVGPEWVLADEDDELVELWGVD